MNASSPKRAQDVKELVTYLTILNQGRGEGRVREARDILRRLGSKRFGAPGHLAAHKLDAIDDIERLEDLVERFIDPGAEGWDDLLQDA